MNDSGKQAGAAPMRLGGSLKHWRTFAAAHGRAPRTDNHGVGRMDFGLAASDRGFARDRHVKDAHIGCSRYALATGMTAVNFRSDSQITLL
jgi:hypothetical protein